MSLKDEMDQVAQEHGMNGNADFFSFKKSGDYTLRILSKPLAMATHFFGKGTPGSVCYGKLEGCPFHTADHENPSVKFQCYVIDRTDGKVKIAELPWSVVSVISDYELDPDWSYQGYPLPYDIRVKVDKENKDPKSIYKTLGVPRREPLTVEEENAYSRKQGELSVEKYIEGRKTKQIEKHKEAGIWITEEQRAEIERKRLEEGARIAAEQGDVVPEVKYPDEEINPEDIPF